LEIEIQRKFFEQSGVSHQNGVLEKKKVLRGRKLTRVVFWRNLEGGERGKKKWCVRVLGGGKGGGCMIVSEFSPVKTSD